MSETESAVSLCELINNCLLNTFYSQACPFFHIVTLKAPNVLLRGKLGIFV